MLDSLLTVALLLAHISRKQVEDKSKADLKKRKLIEEVSIKSFDIRKGKSFTLSLEKPETDLNSEMMP